MLYFIAKSLFSLKTVVLIHKTGVTQQLKHIFLKHFRRETHFLGFCFFPEVSQKS